MNKKHYRFYMDESETSLPRKDGMNCFCYAGVLIAEEDIEIIRANYKAFCEKWGITYPLHYKQIRGKRNDFEWLTQDINSHNRNAQVFIEEYHEFMTSQPLQAFGCVIDKKREFIQTDVSKSWSIDRLAFIRLIQMVTKEVNGKKATVSLYIEGAGKKQDRLLRSYLHDIFQFGDNIGDYRYFEHLSKQVYRKAIIGDLRDVKKDNPFTQIADFCAFPIAKSFYEENYKPFNLLIEKNIIITKKFRSRTLLKSGIIYLGQK